MKKKLALLTMLAVLAAATVPVMADEKDDRIAELEAQVEELQATIEDLEEQLANLAPASTDQTEYKLGETWVVNGQWKVTIDSVEETSERNEYSDYDPAAVYLVTYTYENIGYADDVMDGLYIDLSDGIVDSEGKMGYSYPGDITKYPTETPVGARCEAQSCIGVDNAGDFKINFSTYDANAEKQSAVFAVTVK